MSDSVLPTRRGFVMSVAGGVPAVLAGEPTVSQQPGDGPWNGPAIVKKLYIANRKPGWPFPAVNIADQIKQIDGSINLIEKRYPQRIHFTGGEVLYEDEAGAPWTSSLDDVDGILLVIVTSQVSRQLERVIALNKPTLVFEYPYSGHEWSHAARATQLGKKVDIVSSSDYQDLDPYVDAFFTIHHLRHSKVLVVVPDRQDKPEKQETAQFTQQFGTEFAGCAT